MSRHTARVRAGNDRASLYTEITDKIIAELEAGRIPWVQPWGTAAIKAPLAMPRNASTQRGYAGINVLILWGSVIEHGFSGQSWLTFRQALGLGGHVRKGERGTTVVYADRFTPEDERRRAAETGEEPGAIPFLKRFTVAHPTKLVQSAAMASVAPPKPSYRPHLPLSLVGDGALSDAQLESIIYAGEAHSEFLAGARTVDTTFDVLAAARDDASNAVRFRRGWFLGDGTGAGKGRQAAGILLDNWLKGRRRAVWISKSDKLIEDAQRDWSALGMERLLITPLSRFRQGTPVRLAEGVLFTTYATLRTDEQGEKPSRVRQIVEWLGSDFDGIIIFDESHAMQNAVGGKGERGDQAASQQGRAGLRLQHALPNARVVYVSATGATTVHNLAYAQRLGLWGGDDFPFVTRAEFVEAIEEGGVAAMEVLARDLKALGLYAARSLSYEASNTNLSSTSSRLSRSGYMTLMPARSASSTTTSTRRCGWPTSPARPAR